MANPVSTDALEGLVIAKVDKIQNENEKIVERFLKFFVSSVGIPQEYQNKFIREFWFKILITFFITSVSSQFLHCFFLNSIGDIIQALVFILHSVFLNFATFFIFVRQKYIVEMVKIKDDYFSGFYEKSLVMRNYMTADDKFKNFFVKFGTTTCLVHFSSTVISPLLHFIFSDAEAGSDETLILPSWYPWQISNVVSYSLTFGLQFIQVTSLMVPILGNFIFVVYFVIEIRIQKTNLCTSLSNIVVYAYWESMSNESPIFQMLSANSGGNKSYDELLLEYLQDCIKHHILINLFIRNFIKCYNLVFIGCLAYSVSNLSLIAYVVVLLQKENASWTSYITALEGLAVVIAFILLYCYLGEVITSINIAVRNELYDIKWYEQSAKYRSTMLTFMCLTQKDIVMKAGVQHIASYQLFASVLKTSYSFFNILYTSV
ncbi:uncharacterized protein LOC135840361 [Planococcus citri]|uniref:uncharacterized protein LOC135840361 n=1 Tax=Planococcus citri TaxID=170843 RepID=UPI0031F990DF